MSITNGNGKIPGDSHAQLSTMIQRELEAMIFNKERYDLDHPDNIKNISKAQMRRMAYKKVIEELSTPPCGEEAADSR